MLVNATILDLAAARTRAGRPNTTRFQTVLSRLHSCGEWLEANGLTIIGLRQPLFGEPTVTVTAKPSVYALFSGRYERLGYKQDGALRYEVWEGMDRINRVAVRWVEVVACAH